MSLSKKDPSLRVAANDPHLVSLGGGRLSTAVTIHNISVGDTTIGSSTQCNISLSGPGVKPIHCTIYRSEDNQVTLVPERDARILIDGRLEALEVDLKQGAMITLGESYYLRYNNPAEALQMRSAMGDLFNDFDENPSTPLDYFYEANINPTERTPPPPQQQQIGGNFCKTYNNLKSFDINGWQCPKVFSADLVTVNMPAKAVLGQKYANFAKNLAENHRKDKYNESKNPEGLCVNIPTTSKVKALTDSWEFLTKVQNASTPQLNSKVSNESPLSQSKDHLDDMLKICSEYSERQERSAGSLSSSPVVQNRIKTNGSLPREKKSPFFQDFAANQMQSNNVNTSTNSLSSSSASPNKSSGYENVRFTNTNSSQRVEISNSPKSSGYENVKLIVPQSPRTKIRTNCCLSPKMDKSANIFANDETDNNSPKIPKNTYEDLIKNFEEKFQKEIEAIEECSRFNATNAYKNQTLSANSTPKLKRTNININHLTIDIKSLVSPQNSPRPLKRPAPAPRNLTLFSKSDSFRTNPSSQRLHIEREDLLRRLHTLKMEISSLQQQDNEALISMDMENALVLGELQTLNERKLQLEKEYQILQQKTHRLEAQRNATRVMEENQQAKLKQSIEMKQEQVAKLKEMLQQKPNNECLKEELQNVHESLENDRKSFEDLEFQYLEGESEWQDQKEELFNDEQNCRRQMEENNWKINNLENQDNNTTTSEQQNLVRKRLVALLNDLQECELQFKRLEKKLTSQLHEQQMQKPRGSRTSLAVMSQSLFGSTEMLCPKTSTTEDQMSKSFNENLIFNNKIETPTRESQEHLAVMTASYRNSREASIKLLDSLKEIERNRQLLVTKQHQSILEQEKSKLENMLVQLGRGEGKQKQLEENLSQEKKEKKNNLMEKGNLLKLDRKSKTDSLYSLTHSKKVDKVEDVKQETIDVLIMADTPEITNLLHKKRCSSVMSNESPSHGGESIVSSERRKALFSNQRPLTRYLPIFAQDLDLRRHIESAGHQIALCPHVFLDAYACRGYLHKLGSTFHTWSKRWFVLDRQRQALVYFYEKSERKPRGGAYFSSIDEVYMDHLNASKSSRPHSTFIVKTKKRLYYLQAASDSAARIWIDAIITGAQGNIDY